MQWIEHRCKPSFKAALEILISLKELSSPLESFQWDGSWFGHPGTELIDDYMGNQKVRELIDSGKDAEYIYDYFKNDKLYFMELRKEYLLY